MVELSKVERKRGKAWEAAETVETLARWCGPADRAVSHTQVMAGQASLAIVPHFIMMLWLEHLFTWFQNIKFFQKE